MISLKKVTKSAFAILLAAVMVVEASPLAVKAKATKEVTIKDNISINGIDLGGMSYDEAVAKLGGANDFSETAVTLTSEYGDVVTTLGDIGLSDNTAEVVEEALEYANSGNILERYRDTKLLEKEPLELTVKKTVSSSIIGQMIENNLGEAMMGDGSYSLSKDGGEIKVTVEGNSVSADANAIEEAVEDIINKEGYSGSDVNTKIILADNSENERVKQLSRIKDLLGTYTTSYSSSGPARKTNVQRAASLVNGHVLYPGEQISVYNCISPIEMSNGYELAHAYVGTEVVDSPGGGVCQVATTLYNAVLRAELEVIQRNCHSMRVTYVPISADAAIAGGVFDLKFRNNLDAPIYIESGWDGANLTFSIYGEEYRPANRKIEFESVQTGVINPPAEPIYTEDKSLPPGTEMVVAQAVTGYTGELWKHVYIDGVLTESILINSSKYQNSPAKIAVNTDEEEEDEDKDKEKKKMKKKKKEKSEDNTEATTEKKKEEKTEAPTEKPTEEPTEAPTEAPVDPPEDGNEE
ncbi:MAG: VanW family protein [Eubacterium sp.]|nr:VanW family protein [Eubacterium sp.]